MLSAVTLTLMGTPHALFAQEGETGNEPDPQASSTPEPDAPPEDARDDPFSLEGIVEAPPAPESTARAFRPAEQRPARLPELTLRGIGRMSRDGEPTVLLEVGQLGMFIVRKGDTISLQNLPGDNVLRILEVTDISVTVEAGSFDEVIVVR